MNLRRLLESTKSGKIAIKSPLVKRFVSRSKEQSLDSALMNDENRDSISPEDAETAEAEKMREMEL